VGDLTGPISDGLIDDLEALKLTLAGLQGEDLDPVRAGLIGREISAIRLHLKRLALERPVHPGAGPRGQVRDHDLPPGLTPAKLDD
jgi:hypothetical protein